MATNNLTGISDYVEEANILHMSGLRFHQGIRSVNMLAKMMEERFKCEEKMAHVLEDNSCDWSKKLADISSEGNGEFDHGSIYVAITKALMEPIEEAKIYNLVKNEGLGDDGPVHYLRSWKAQMESCQIQNKTMKLYSTAWDKQQSTLKEIEKAKEYFYVRKYKLEKGLRQLQADPPVLSSRAEAKLNKTMDRYREKCEVAQEVYKRSLKMAEEGRGKDLVALRKSERKFVKFEKNRLKNTKASIEKFLDISDKLDTERPSHIKVIDDIIGVLENLNVETEKRNLDTQYKNGSELTAFEEFDEMNKDQEDKIQSWVKKITLRKRNKIQIDITNSMTNKTFEIDHDSDDIKDISLYNDTGDGTEDDESDVDIFSIDQKGPNTKIKLKEQHENKDVCADGKDENLPQGTSSIVQAAPDTVLFGLHNAVVSNKEPEMWAIPTRNRSIELDVIWRCTSPIPPKLTKKERKHGKDAREVSKQSTNVDLVKDKGQLNDVSSDPDSALPCGLANVRVIATEGYQAQNRDELTFKAGQTIKQKIPANSDGMAYGWIRKGKLKRKTYGYYPANLVELKPKKEKTGILGRLSKKGAVLKIAS
ncbi:hypothetical protein ACJMK2_028318 [Sinanodonta woodiana]|uniref:SH3 domain-containing protein n=1 Tax=Sinanodonta woodiana TaxID=1069815 RepID=A0ABD3XA91_SINWO